MRPWVYALTATIALTVILVYGVLAPATVPERVVMIGLGLVAFGGSVNGFVRETRTDS